MLIFSIFESEWGSGWKYLKNEKGLYSKPKGKKEEGERGFPSTKGKRKKKRRGTP